MIPDKELSWVSLETRRTLNESTPYLSNLLKDERYIYNHVKYQNLESYVNTCGRHVCRRIYRLIHDNLNLREYYDYMKLRDADNTGYDMIAAPFIMSKLE